MSRLVESGIITVLFLVAVNVVFLNIFIISKRTAPVAATTSSKEEIDKSVCDAKCQEEIVQQISSRIPTHEPTIHSIAKVENSPKEFIITLGTGSTISKDWIDIPGVEAEIDTRNYPPIDHVFFETYLSVPQAQGFAHAKLFNETDKHDVWFSEVSMEADKVVNKNVEVKLEPGKKIYRVMMKSTLGVESKLHNARIRIITK
jgi:hypothetical protein